MTTSLFGSAIFGPIHSRRLGVSLGVNLLPATGKVCSFDCIYCECGYNAERRGGKLPAADDVIAQLEAKLKSMSAAGDKLDVITFAGNGEPTLHPEFARVIDATIALRDRYYPDAKVSVLSNSTRVDRPEVFAALNRVDNNILKLDSLFPATVALMDSPVAADFAVEKVVDNLCRFEGNLIIQTMFLRGEHGGKTVDNTTDAEVEAWLEALKKIAPRQVMVYSIDRPTPEAKLVKVPREELEKIAERARALGFEVSVA
jgi:wyosine [tRNA(Phe)-imidazoG37] synthetase (radical SAM superfamily)